MLTKYYVSKFFFIATIFAFFVPSVSFALEDMPSFDVVFMINTDSTVDVTETIVYDFGTDVRHGIYRDIPTVFSTGQGTQKVSLHNISVSDEMGVSQTIYVSGSDPVKIRIGDPDITTVGKHTYVVKYTIQGGMLFGDSVSEFYWNATGNKWNVSISETRIRVIMPKEVQDASIVQKACYVGAHGATTTCPITVGRGSSAEEKDVLLAKVFYASPLSPGEGITVAVGVPKGIIKEPSNVMGFLANGLIALLPLAVFIFLFRRWWLYGRDPKGRGTIIPEYEPPIGLSPMQAGAIYDEVLQPKDLVAEIIYLARHGRLKIRRLEEKVLGVFSTTDYELERTKNHEEVLEPFQRLILNNLFTNAGGNIVKISSLKNDFHSYLQEIYKKVYQDMTDKEYFSKNPQSVRSLYILIGIVLFASTFFFSDFISAFVYRGIVLISMASISIMFFVASYFMPAKTAQGVMVKEHMEGLKMYIDTAEKDRIDFHNAPEKNPELFEKLLPYAIVFGLEKKWAKEFEGLSMAEPSWYSGGSHTAFSAVAFANDMSGFSTSMVSASGAGTGGASGGGGFSGGGGGGGGGGSW